MTKQRQSPVRDDPSQHKTLDDVIAPDLWVLFCGINPGLKSGQTGHHFARPGNRFWPTLHRSGFTERLLAPAEERELLRYGLGITNLAARVTATAAELAPAELQAGGEALVRKIQTYRPRVLAILGIGAYRTAFALPRAAIGRQPNLIDQTHLWVLPNPSGLNAHYTPTALANVFREFRLTVERELGSYTAPS